MAIAFDAASNSGYLSSTGTYSGSHTCTGSNRYLVLSLAVFIPESITEGDSHDPSYNGVAMTLLRSKTTADGFIRSELWGLVAPTSGSHTVSVQLPEANADFVACLSSFTGVDQSTPTEGVADATGLAGSSTVDVTVSTDQSWVIDVIASDDTSITAGDGQTARGQQTGARGTGAQSTEGPVSPSTVTMNWTDSSDRWAMCAIVLRPPATAITGDAAITLGALTTTATATLALTATQSTTLGDATVTATGFPSPPVGSASITFDALTTSATATLALSATQSTQLGDATCTATGSVPAVEGSASITLDALTTTATGTLPLVATQTTTLGNATSTATATLALVATQATTLSDATVSATGSSTLSATADITLGALSTSAAATLALAATQTTTLGDATVTATAETPLSASAAITLGDLTTAATGELAGPLAAADITLGTLTTEATAETTLSAAADITLGALTIAGTSTLDIVATASITLGELTIAGTSEGVVTGVGTASITLGELTLVATDRLEPRHCCGIWPCESVQVTVGASATYNCGSGAVAFPALGARVLKLVQFTADYHRWEYRAPNAEEAAIYEITLECDRTQERFDEGYGPCVEITFLYDNQYLGTIGDPGILRVCFGPIIMDDRDCACLKGIGGNDEDFSDPGANTIGFSWGTAFITGAAINADPQNDCDCDFAMDAGDGILAQCLCSDICNCFGIDKRLHFAWECDGFDTIEVDLDWYSADEFPGGATSPPSTSAGGAWWGTGSTGIEGCTIEVQLQCLLSGFEAPFIWLHDDATECDAFETACTSPNIVTLSEQCRDGDTPFEYVFAYCSVSTPACAGGTILSTITFTERV